MTCSIIARDTKTWEIWGWVFTKAFDCSNCLVAKAWVGIVATQGFTNNSYWPRWRDLLWEWKTPEEVVNILVNEDDESSVRQLAVLNKQWDFFQFSGSKCIENVSEYQWENFCVQWNLMTNSEVVEAVWKAFEEYSNLPFDERIIAALKAGQEKGGDLRWIQSAALIIVWSEENEEWENYKVQLSVNDNNKSLEELERLLQVQKWYAIWWKWFDCFQKWDVENGVKLFEKAENFLWTEYEDLIFWKAHGLSKVGYREESEKVIKWLWENWWELYKRL